MKRNVSWVWVLGGLVGLAILASLLGRGDSSQADGFGPHVAVVTLQGAISDSSSASLLGGRSGGSRSFSEELDQAVRDKSAQAIVIRINSPGGSPSASQEMYRAVLRARKSKKVYASMGDVAASGGYYVAAACDKIFANPSTLTGSIGVISQLVNYQELLRKVGVGETTIKSGKFKDVGSPTRPLSAEDRALLQAMNRDIYEQFVDDVVAGRKGATSGRLSKSKLLPIADGRVLTGRQAMQAGLVDSMGGLYEASQAVGKAAGIAGEVSVRDVDRGGGLLNSLFGASSSTSGGGVNGAASEAGESFGRAFASGVQQEMSASLRQSSGVPEVRGVLGR